MTVDHLDLLKPVPLFSGTSVADPALKKLRLKTHATFRKVSGDIEDRFHFNTAISAVMELVNAIYQFDIGGAVRDRTALALIKEAIQAVILLLAPRVPQVPLDAASPVHEHPGYQHTLQRCERDCLQPGLGHCVSLSSHQ